METPIRVKVTKVRKVEKPSTVCDLQVEGNSNLFVTHEITKNPILAHNCALIELIYNIKISGWILYYISRDTPLSICVPTGKFITDKSKAAYLKLMERWAAHYQHVMVDMEEFKDIQLLIDEKPCKTQEYYEMKYKKFDICPLAKGGVCFNQKALKSTMKESWDNRPEDWQTKNAPAYLKRMKYHV